MLVSLGTRKSFDHLISDSKAPKRPEMESGMTTPPKMRRVAENDYEIGESTQQSNGVGTPFCDIVQKFEEICNASI